MNINSIGTSYTPLRSSQNFGMELDQSALQIVDKAKEIAENCDKIWNTKRKTEELNKYLSTIRETRPNDRLSISIKNNDDIDYVDKEARAWYNPSTLIPDNLDFDDKIYTAWVNRQQIHKAHSENAFDFIKSLANFLKKESQAK